MPDCLFVCPGDPSIVTQRVKTFLQFLKGSRIFLNQQKGR